MEPIDTQRLHLRCLSLPDAVPLSRMLTPEVSRWLASWPSPYTVEMATARIEAAQQAAAAGRGLPLAVVERDGGATIGYIGVFREHDAPWRAILGYWLGEQFHGRGFMREAAPAAVRAGFAWLAVEEMEAHAQPENAASLAVMRRCGMAPRGERLIYVPARACEELCVVYGMRRPVEL